MLTTDPRDTAGPCMHASLQVFTYDTCYEFIYLTLVSTHVRTEPKHSLRGSKCALLISKIKRYFRQTEWTKSKRGNTDDRAWTLSTQDAVLKRNSYDRQRRKPERALGDFLAQIWLWIILTQRTQRGCEGSRIYRHTPLGLEPNFCPN